ncbi:hypothetical protein GDO86_009513 [Hymenochirus boettgeri]|uniref:Uncharacterized protein n=1 Tax=Hymenochirus boettgeri TaxID=247094 RepID=A0A8T2JJ84_9PIPI|nr:hypothetical protein GDO86_009513 [Hymenochirus boettgeri]
MVKWQKKAHKGHDHTAPQTESHAISCAILLRLCMRFSLSIGKCMRLKMWNANRTRNHNTPKYVFSVRCRVFNNLKKTQAKSHAQTQEKRDSVA